RRHAHGTAALHGRRPAVGGDAQHRAGRGRAVPGLARSGRRARHAVRRLPGPGPKPRVPGQGRLSGPYRASEEFGARLRRLREAAGLNGKQLATALSWPHSKISKIELARQRPTADEVTAWAHATGAVGDLEALLADLRSLRVESASWRRQLRGGHGPRQRASIGLEHAATTIRAFEPGVIPGLLQTADYARQLLRRLAAL